LQKDNDLEYYRNRCNILEQQVRELIKDNRQLRDENKQLRNENMQLQEEITQIKKTVSALAARNIRAKPDKHQNKKKKHISNHARKSRCKPTHIDDTITVDQKECNICGTELSVPTDSYSRIVEDILPAKAITTQYIIGMCLRPNSYILYNLV
jgi:regulator of replication initiation timing